MVTTSVTRAVAAAALTVMLVLPGTDVLAGSRDSETYRQLNLFGDVFERVRAEYVEETTDEDLIKAAINGMLSSLDPHSSYLDPKNYRDMQMQTRGEFGGLGIEVTMEDGYVKVVSPIDDTPAARAGLQPGDVITHLDGESVMGLTLADAVEKMRGKPDTDLTLMIRRGEEAPFEVTVTRDIIRIRSVRWRTEGDIGYLRITSFSEQTGEGIGEAFAEFEDELGGSMQGVLLDLRNNPGGLLDQAITVTDTFLDRGEIVSTRGRDERDGQRYNATEGDIAKGLPMVVLINGGSASASEIVAGALKDHRRAIVVGTRSFGKGSVQTIQPIPGHGAIRLTTARYYTPAGVSIQAKGIEPDLVIEPGRLEKLEAGLRPREENLRGALPNGDDDGTRSDPPRIQMPETEVPEEELSLEDRDYQLARAIDLLRGIALYRGRATN